MPTIVLGSQGVRQDYVSSTRYTHYSLLRTIEDALGLGTLTANDRYAQPLNDVFDAERANSTAVSTQTSSSPLPATTASTALASGAASTSPTAGTPAAAPPATGTAAVTTVAATTTAGASQPVAWVANYGSDTVTPVT